MAKNNKTRIEQAQSLANKKKGGTKSEADNFDRSSIETMASLVDAWLLRLEERNYSPRTVEMNHWTLRSFLKWSQERDVSLPEQVTKPMLESYQRWLYRYKQSNGKPLSVRTQRQRLGSVQRFFAYLCKMNRILANPASDLDLPRQPARQLPKGLPMSELLDLLNVPDISDPLGVRDRAILEVLYASGIRRAELVKLELHDIDSQARTLHVRQGKGGKSRLVPIGEKALDWLQKYLDDGREKLRVNEDEKALFLSGYGEAFSPGSLGNLVKKMMLEAGINREGSCHLLRHTCATHMLEGGADIRLIQQFLGHSKLDTTSIYTQVAITHLQEVYKRSHPSAGKSKRK